MAMENFQEVNEIDQTVNLEQNLPNSIGQIPHQIKLNPSKRKTLGGSNNQAGKEQDNSRTRKHIGSKGIQQAIRSSYNVLENKNGTQRLSINDEDVHNQIKN